MSDVFTKEKRSEVMKSVASKGNKSTELKLISIFKKYGIKGWKRNYKLVGRPDFVFLKKRIAIFADGCFWHGHNCRNTIPANNADYWKKKRSKNIERDLNVTNLLTQKGWRVIRLWECEINKGNINDNLKLIQDILGNSL